MTMINTNISALKAQNSSRLANSQLDTAISRLSSGKRINSAKDDAAGMAIASRMNAQTRGLTVAIRNANDGISLAQTAEGALGEVSNMLQRMRELAVQSANGTNASTDRAALQAELSQLVSEVDAVAETTSFNGIKLLDGSAKGVNLQVGNSAADSLSFSVAGASAADLGLTGYKVEGTVNTGRVAASLNGIAADDVQINGKAAATAAFTATSNTAKALADAINTNTANTKVTATAYNNVTGGLPSSTSFAAGAITINGSSIGAAGSVDELITVINRDAPGVTASKNSDGTVALSNNTGNDIVIAGSAPTSAGFTAGTYTGYVAIESVDGSDVKVQAKSVANGYTGGAGTVADVQSFGLNESVEGSTFSGKSVGTTALASTDDVKINGVAIGASSSASASAKAAAINAVSAETGVSATAKTQVKVTLDFTDIPGATDVKINNAEVDLSGVTDLAGTITAINNANVGVTATNDADGNLILTNDSGADVKLEAAAFISAATTVGGEAGTGSVAAGLSFTGTLSLEGKDGVAISVEGSAASLAKVGLAAQGNADQVGGALSISTSAGAKQALGQIDSAIDKVSSARGDLGAIQNRLETRVNVLTSTSQNITEAQSRIEDTDFSSETTKLARAQILSQAATAMLAQANQSQQNVMSLLR